MQKLTPKDWTAVVLVVVGGMNWGLIGLFKYDVVANLLGFAPILPRIVYTVVGLAAIYVAAVAPKFGKSE